MLTRHLPVAGNSAFAEPLVPDAGELWLGLRAQKDHTDALSTGHSPCREPYGSATEIHSEKQETQAPSYSVGSVKQICVEREGPSKQEDFDREGDRLHRALPTQAKQLERSRRRFPTKHRCVPAHRPESDGHS